MQAVSSAGLTAVAELFHAFVSEPDLKPDPKRLAASGITGVVLLAESHCAIHTWPEKNAVSVDVYVCNYGQNNSEKARQLSDLLVQAFRPEQTQIKEVLRGG
jgi:S-adenosylmethionine decarboxylase